jgi:hypothetical protein
MLLLHPVHSLRRKFLFKRLQRPLLALLPTSHVLLVKLQVQVQTLVIAGVLVVLRVPRMQLLLLPMGMLSIYFNSRVYCHSSTHSFISSSVSHVFVELLCCCV